VARLRPASVELLRPQKKALLSLLADQMSPRLLEVISNADYGYDADKHLKELTKICKTLAIPEPLLWEPKEVLQLIRWSRPDVEGWKPGLTGTDGHLIRAFSCAALVVACASELNRDVIDDENSTLAPLVESLLVLGRQYQRAGLSELAWRIQNPPEEWEDEPFFWLGLLVLAVEVFGRQNPDLVDELVDRLLESEDRVRSAPWCVSRDDSGLWLFGLTFFDLNEHVWVSFAGTLRAVSKQLRRRTCANLERIAELLEGGRNVPRAT